MAKSIEKRLDAIEKEIATLKAGYAEKTPAYDKIAVAKCEEYYRIITGCYNNKTPYNICIDMARAAFKDKRSISHQGLKPFEYIKTLGDAEELFEIFRAFLQEYLRYLSERRGNR